MARWGRWAKIIPCAKVTKGCSDEEVTAQQQHLRGWGWGAGALVILTGWCRRALVRIPKQAGARPGFSQGWELRGERKGLLEEERKE